MKKIKFILLILFLSLCHNNSYACDLLSIGIGENKSSIKNIFGELPESQYVKDENNPKKIALVAKYTDQTFSFCDDINVFGNALMNVYIVDNIIGAFELEVTGPLMTKDNNLIKADALNQYVQSNFGPLDTENNWAGYKHWTIGEKKIYYYKIKSNTGEIIEGVAVTSQNYSDVLIEGEY